MSVCEKCAKCGLNHAFVSEWKHMASMESLRLLSLCEENSALRAELDQYLGWSPGQFLRYQDEHKKLQEDYRALDSALKFACDERDTLRAERDALKEDLRKLEWARVVGGIHMCPVCKNLRPTTQEILDLIQLNRSAHDTNCWLAARLR